LVDALTKPENQARLAERALKTPLGDLKTFLDYSLQTDELKPVFHTLATALAKLENQSRLGKRGLETHLDQLSSFLDFAQRTAELHTVFRNLYDELVKKANREALLNRFIYDPMDALVSFLTTKATCKLAHVLLADVDTVAWEAQRSSEGSPKIDSFIAFQRLVAKAGRLELVAAPALNLVRSAMPEKWHSQNIGLNHFSHVLRHARQEATLEEITHFVDIIANADWLDGQIIQAASTGGLAGSLLSIAMFLPEHLRQRFRRPSLEKRVKRDIAGCKSTDYPAWFAAISLLGAAAMLDLRIDALRVPRPQAVDLWAMFELSKPNSAQIGVGPFQVTFWVGLKELARLCDGLDAVPAEHGKEILARWRATGEAETAQALPPHIRQSNAAMIAWLERCQDADWRLL